MSPYSRHSKTPAKLADSTQRRLNMYAIAAGAAGVGVLALSQPADAKIVYTPAHVKVYFNLMLDLNHDGINDFYFSIISYAMSSGGAGGLAVRPERGGNNRNLIFQAEVVKQRLCTAMASHHERQASKCNCEQQHGELWPAYNATVLPNSITDIAPEFMPVLLALGEPTDFEHDVEYALIHITYWAAKD